MNFDTIVIGAGPAGSTAARECASRGLSTLLLDRAEFPRDKPCGGGVNVRAARLLPFDLTPVVERRIHAMQISVKQRHAFERRSIEPLCYLTQRRHLDTFMVEKAIHAGARFQEGVAVTEVSRGERRVEVRAGRQTFTGQALVIADGANGPSARLAGVRVARSKGIALEGNVTQERYPIQWQDRFGIDVGAIRGGYGWLFPKGDHLNIGIGGMASEGPALRKHLNSLADFYGVDSTSLWALKGHPLPVRLPGGSVVDGNVAVVGDAAGLLDPLTGEGIYGAIWSGRAAAAAIAPFCAGDTANLHVYQDAIDRELAEDLLTGGQLHLLFHVSPAAWARFVRTSPSAWRLVCALLTGGITYSGIKRRSRLVGAGIDVGSSALQLAQRVKHDRWPAHVLEMLGRATPDS
ncbi:MAG: geranylgeranyl reductase family protein [Chloroflexota bacterium]